MRAAGGRCARLASAGGERGDGFVPQRHLQLPGRDRALPLLSLLRHPPSLPHRHRRLVGLGKVVSPHAKPRHATHFPCTAQESREPSRHATHFPCTARESREPSRHATPRHAIFLHGSGKAASLHAKPCISQPARLGDSRAGAHGPPCPLWAGRCPGETSRSPPGRPGRC